MSILIESIGIRIFTSPKVLSSTLKNLAFEIDTGKQFESFRANGKDHWVHRYYPLRPLKNNELEGEVLKIAIIRDPVDRFISMYRNRVLLRRPNSEEEFIVLPELGLELVPDINTLAVNLEAYREAVRDIRHHTTPQSVFLGKDLAVFDHVIWFSDIGKLTSLLEERTKSQLLLPHINRSSSTFYERLSRESLGKLRDFYASDYELVTQFKGNEF